MANTVSLCMICKNEENNLPILLDQVCDVLEEVIIVDTGSTDKTLDIIKQKQLIYKNLRLEHFTWVDDFSAARNYSFSFATQCFNMFLDCDDQIDPAALKHFKDNILEDPNVDCWMLDYIYSQYPDGSPQTILGRERFMRRSLNPKFMGAIHETCDISNMRQRHYTDLKVIHNRAGKVIDHGRNLRILKVEYQKNPNDPRTAYYYGKELFDHINPKCEEVLLHYLTLPGRYYDDEVNCRSRIAKHFLAQKKHGEAIRMANEIYHLDGSRKRVEFFWTYGAVEQDLGNFEMAIDWYKRCLVEPPGPPRVLALEYFTWNPLRRISECYTALGRHTEAREFAQRVKRILPGDHGTEVWFKEKFTQPPKHKEGYNLLTMEFGMKEKLRWESYEAHELDVHTLQIIPLPDECLDGAVINSTEIGELGRVLKPGAFLWSVQPVSHPSLQYLGRPVYRKHPIFNYIKLDSTKPTIGYVPQNLDYGPYRIRINNLIKSAIKNGYPVRDITADRRICDIYIGQAVEKGHRRHAKTLVLDVCEKLPLNLFNPGFEEADIITVCSLLLKEHVLQMFPNAKVHHIDDHFELTDDGWL